MRTFIGDWLVTSLPLQSTANDALGGIRGFSINGDNRKENVSRK